MNHQIAHQQLEAATLRVSLGVILLAHGLLKVMIFGIEDTVWIFESLGLPAIAAYSTIIAEITGGLYIIVGVYSRFYSRFAAALSLPLLLGASWAHFSNGWVFSNEGGGWEYPLLLVVLALIVTTQGRGRFSPTQPLLNRR